MFNAKCGVLKLSLSPCVSCEKSGLCVDLELLLPSVLCET